MPPSPPSNLEADDKDVGETADGRARQLLVRWRYANNPCAPSPLLRPFDRRDGKLGANKPLRSLQCDPAPMPISRTHIPFSGGFEESVASNVIRANAGATCAAEPMPLPRHHYIIPGPLSHRVERCDGDHYTPEIQSILWVTAVATAAKIVLRDL